MATKATTASAGKSRSQPRRAWRRCSRLLRRRRPGVGAGVATVLIESVRSEKLREDDRCHPPSFGPACRSYFTRRCNFEEMLGSTLTANLPLTAEPVAWLSE